MKVLLLALNAKFIHTSLALRYIKSYCNEYENRMHILETSINNNENEIIKAIYKPKNPNSFPGDINTFNVPYPVLQILNEGLYSGYSKIHEKAVESLLPVMALRVQEHLLNIKEKSLNAAFNLQDVFFKEIGRCAQSFAELQRRQLGI